MALVVPDLGEIELLTKLLINTADTEDYILRLYKNNYTPIAATVIGSFTEADFTNYAEKTIARSDWATPSTVSNKAESSVATQSWTCGVTTNTIYGYYVVGATSGVCLWAEEFAAARVLADGDILNLTPKFNLSSAN
jgi:hypothetical protein